MSCMSVGQLICVGVWWSPLGPLKIDLFRAKCSSYCGLESALNVFHCDLEGAMKRWNIPFLDVKGT